MVILMINILIGIIIGTVLTTIVILKTKKKPHDYSELIKQCIAEANKDLSNCSKKKHSDKS